MPNQAVSQPRNKPRVFIDADVLFAGSAAPSEHGASLIVLRMAEISLIEALTSEQVIEEAERNLVEKLPNALPVFRLIVARCLQVVPVPGAEVILEHTGEAHPVDLPILVAALLHDCPWLVTFNTRHYRPGHPRLTVLSPGDFLLRVRDLLAHL
jgi:hypothetical protein